MLCKPVRPLTTCRHLGMVQTEDKKNCGSALPQCLFHRMMPQNGERLQHALSANTGLVRRLSHSQTFRGHSSTINALDWSSDGELLLSASDDCRVKLWSTEGGKTLQSFDSVSFNTALLAMSACSAEALQPFDLWVYAACRGTHQACTTPGSCQTLAMSRSSLQQQTGR